MTRSGLQRQHQPEPARLESEHWRERVQHRQPDLISDTILERDHGAITVQHAKCDSVEYAVQHGVLEPNRPASPVIGAADGDLERHDSGRASTNQCDDPEC